MSLARVFAWGFGLALSGWCVGMFALMATVLYAKAAVGDEEPRPNALLSLTLMLAVPFVVFVVLGVM
jgi:hypothetical protein